MAKKKKTKLWEWQVAIQEGGVICVKCGAMNRPMTIDHIVPIFFIDSFDLTGTAKYEDEDNFQILCRPCNILKAGRFDLTNRKTIPIIKKYLKLYESSNNNA
mgnify:FL=1